MMRLCLALLVIAGPAIAAACSTISSDPDPQDSCRIGAISPEEYRTIAAEVAAMPLIDWDAALAAERQADGVAAALHERLEQVLSVRMSMDEQVAAMQALMRSIGAEFTSATRGSEGVIYHYRLDVNRIGMIRLLSRWATMSVMFGLPAAPGGIRPIVQVSAMMPEMLDPGRPGYVKVSQEQPCPPMPLDAPTRQGRIEKQEQRN
jgi:hypothetical protein